MTLVVGRTLQLQSPFSLSVLECIQPMHPDTGRALYKVKDNHSGLTYALKQYDRGLNPAKEIQREMHALNRIPHPSPFPYVHMTFQHDGTTFLLMEWLEGTSLGKTFRQPPRDKNELRFRVSVLANAADTVSKLHKNRLCHRDIKPDNLLLVDPSNAQKGVLLTDFGNVNVQRALTEGTPGFNSPEQSGRRQVGIGPATDIFSLGQTGWWMMTGTVRDAWPLPDWSDWDPPLPRLQDACPHAPTGLSDILERCMAFDPARRPADARSITHELRTLKW